VQGCTSRVCPITLSSEGITGKRFYRAGELSVLSGALAGNLAMLWSVSPCILPDDQPYLSAGYTVQGMSNVMKVARVGCAEVRSASIEKNIVIAG
jgi:hypothetical protein